MWEFQIGFPSSRTSQMTDCCVLMCYQFGWKNLHLVLIVPAKNPCSHPSLWSSVRHPERDANKGVESEIVQLGHSCASKKSRHMDRRRADGFWISLSQSWEELLHCASLGHIDIPHTSPLFQILWSLYEKWTCSEAILILKEAKGFFWKLPVHDGGNIKLTYHAGFWILKCLFLFVKFSASLQSVLQSFMWLHHLRKGCIVRSR